MGLGTILNCFLLFLRRPSVKPVNVSSCSRLMLESLWMGRRLPTRYSIQVVRENEKGHLREVKERDLVFLVIVDLTVYLAWADAKIARDYFLWV